MNVSMLHKGFACFNFIDGILTYGEIVDLYTCNKDICLMGIICVLQFCYYCEINSLVCIFFHLNEIKCTKVLYTSCDYSQHYIKTNAVKNLLIFS